ncbi:hypothetical protein J4460_08035 [Candidatus Woesearchaeota archaeon]|nr:hypothetical protein [Candidatus Woesearchaeota archaeon]HIH38309.1 hypothetical protein [Candidatus Woesearchaeota archaeon]HIH48447.1 hypothetical protein [Candidatus Woesearchaeota archaeon]HIJ03299.1 hypothetical protein [Candidatus Woesearchaeota archaeon]
MRLTTSGFLFISFVLLFLSSCSSGQYYGAPGYPEMMDPVMECSNLVENNCGSGCSRESLSTLPACFDLIREIDKTKQSTLARPDVQAMLQELGSPSPGIQKKIDALNTISKFLLKYPSVDDALFSASISELESLQAAERILGFKSNDFGMITGNVIDDPCVEDPGLCMPIESCNWDGICDASEDSCDICGDCCDPCLQDPSQCQTMEEDPCKVDPASCEELQDPCLLDPDSCMPSEDPCMANPESCGDDVPPIEPTPISDSCTEACVDPLSYECSCCTSPGAGCIEPAPIEPPPGDTPPPDGDMGDNDRFRPALDIAQSLFMGYPYKIGGSGNTEIFGSISGTSITLSGKVQVDDHLSVFASRPLQGGGMIVGINYRSETLSLDLSIINSGQDWKIYVPQFQFSW